MKLLSRIGISLATLIMTAAPAAVQAQVSGCFFPFWGGYGYGYGAPSYGGYYAGYSPMWGVPAPMGMYSASYAPVSNCCVPSCCDPCGGSCASGSCAPTTGTGTLKPSTDENFIQKSREDQELPEKERTFGTDDETDPNRRYQRERNPGDGFEPGTRRTPASDPAADPATDPASDTGWENRNRNPASGGSRDSGAPAGGATDPTTPFEPAGTNGGTGGTDNDFPPFSPTLNEQSTNKPPMSDPATDPAAAPAADPAEDMNDGFGTPSTDPEKEKSPSDFLNPDKDSEAKPTDTPAAGANPSAFRSQLREVLPAQRLARKTVPQTGSNFAGRQSREKATRWISLPLTEGHARL